MIFKTYTKALLISTVASGVAAYGHLYQPEVRPVNSEFRDHLPDLLRDLPNLELQRYPLEYIKQYVSNAEDYPDVFVQPCRGIKYDGAALSTFTHGQNVTMRWTIDNMYGGQCSVYLFYNGGKSSMLLGKRACGTVQGLDSMEVTLPNGDLGCGAGGACFLQWKWETDVTHETYVNCADIKMEGDTTATITADAQPTVTTITVTQTGTATTATATATTITVDGNPTVTTVTVTPTGTSTPVLTVTRTVTLGEPSNTTTYTVVNNGTTTLVVIAHPTADIGPEGPIDCIVLGGTTTTTSTLYVLDLETTTQTHTSTRLIQHSTNTTSTLTTSIPASTVIAIEDVTVLLPSTVTQTSVVSTTITITVTEGVATTTATPGTCTHGDMKCCNGPQEYCICSNGTWLGPYQLTPSPSFKCAANGNRVQVVPV